MSLTSHVLGGHVSEGEMGAFRLSFATFLELIASRSEPQQSTVDVYLRVSCFRKDRFCGGGLGDRTSTQKGPNQCSIVEMLGLTERLCVDLACPPSSSLCVSETL